MLVIFGNPCVIACVDPFRTQRMNSSGLRANRQRGDAQLPGAIGAGRQMRLTKKLKISALMMSTKKAPTKGTIRKALCESPNF